MVARTGALVLLLAVTYALLACALYAGLTTRAPGANDFYSRWKGAQALFLKGQDPYSEEVTREIQQGMFGRPAGPNEDQVAFAYPLYAAFLAWPLVGLPYAAAEALWMAGLLMLAGGSALALAYRYQWPRTMGATLGALAFALLWYPSVRAILLGQYAVVVLAGFAFGLLLLQAGRSGAAGGAAALTLVKPHVALAGLAVLVGWAGARRDKRFALGLGVGVALLLVPAQLLLPAWPLEFIRAIDQYHDYITIGPPVQVLAEIVLPSTWPAGPAALIVLGLLAVAAVWVRGAGSGQAGDMALELGVIVTTLAMVRTATSDQILLLVPWMHWLGELLKRKRAGTALALGVMLIVLPWAVFIGTLQGNQEAPVATTTAALLTLGGFLFFYWPRRQTAAARWRRENAT